MLCRARIPEGIKSGTIVPIEVSENIVVRVRLPKGRVGETFLFEVTPDSWESAQLRSSSSATAAATTISVTSGDVIAPLESELAPQRRNIFHRLDDWLSLVIYSPSRFLFHGHNNDHHGWGSAWNQFVMGLYVECSKERGQENMLYFFYR